MAAIPMINMFLMASGGFNDPVYVISYENRYDVSPQEMDIAKLEMSWCKAKEISNSLIYDAISLWKTSKTGNFPTLNDITEYYMNKSCLCVQDIEPETRKRFLTHHISLYGRLPYCIETETSMMYHAIHNEFPSEEELNNTFQRTYEFGMNPEEFHAKDKKIIPVANLDKMKSDVMQECKDYPTCTICQSQIEKGEKYYKLKPCNHYFHADNCLGECTIINWLSKNRKCPMCKTEVVVDCDDKASAAENPK